MRHRRQQQPQCAKYREHKFSSKYKSQKKIINFLVYLLPGGSPEFGNLCLEHVAGLLCVLRHGLGLLELLQEALSLTLCILLLPAQTLDLAGQLVHLVLQPLAVGSLVIQLTQDLLGLGVTPSQRTNKREIIATTKNKQW